MNHFVSDSSIQRMQYYPSGLPWKDCYRADEHPIKYNGKEFVEMHGIDEYDSQARWYYPAIMRTTTMDPLCEKYYSTSPYAWCGNNPINYVDPDGKQVTVSVSNVALGNTTIKLFSGQECKNNPLLNSKTVTVPFYEVVVTNESGSKCTAYFTRIGYRGNANDPNQDPEEVTFDVREPGDKFRAVIKDRWNKQNHVLGATDGCLMAVGTNTIDATVNLPDMPNTSTEMQEQFMQAIINMQLEDEQNNKNSDIYVTFEQLY